MWLFLTACVIGVITGLSIEAAIVAFVVVRWLGPRPVLWAPVLTAWATCVQASPEGFTACVLFFVVTGWYAVIAERASRD
ncbi:MAG TPA: hypothetical protein VGJ20_20600 [Xanthobacteraceae bacterium]|jgi:hypothetical protein